MLLNEVCIQAIFKMKEKRINISKYLVNLSSTLMLVKLLWNYF